MTRFRSQYSPYALWIVVSSWLVVSGWVLSLIHRLNPQGYALSLLFLGAFLIFSPVCKNTMGIRFPTRLGQLRRRFGKLIPFIYLIYLLGALVGGALHSPSNYDAICYRLPRILHWLSEGQWHWIGGCNDRMDFSATGMEWLMSPILILLKTDRLLFLINIISYALLPGLIYSAFTGLGISRRVAWYWMWILPTAYCFVLQAGSIGNDCLAAVYLLAAAVFSLQAVKRGSWFDASLAFLSAALLTGAKATNLPLLLPLLVLIYPILGILWRRPIAAMGVLMVSILVSFAPIAYETMQHTGDWSGDPKNLHQVKIRNPVVGIIGNTLQLSVGMIAPPILPNAKSLSAKTEKIITDTPLKKLRDYFPRLDLDFGEIPTEEAAGVGIGITILALLSLIGGMFLGAGGIATQRAMIFGGLAWISLLAYMTKMGSESTARLIAPYYLVTIIPLLALRSQERMTRSRFWRVLAIVCMLTALLPLILNPARPLLPVNFMISCASNCLPHVGISERMKRVYTVYANRSDSLAEVRAHVPYYAKTIGFAGTANDTEYPFWKTFSGIKVKDLNPSVMGIPELKKVDAIVGSESGFYERYHIKTSELSTLISGKTIWEGKINTLASRESVTWYVIVTDSDNNIKP